MSSDAATRKPVPRSEARLAKLLGGLHLDSTVGLEIGALNRPSLKQGGRVFYADHADTQSIREKYRGDAAVCIDDIVEVDLVWTDGKLAEIAGAQKFDYAIASHVIEHVPDIIWWLSEIASVMRPFGSLRLAIPDKRFCFDTLRTPSTVADLLAAWLERRRRPAAREILDFWGHWRDVDAGQAWRGSTPDDTSFRLREMPAAMQRCRLSIDEGVYQDVHCTVYTPHSFAAIMHALATLQLLPFACTEIIATAPGELEFFVHMMQTDDRAVIEDSWKWAVWILAERDRVGGGTAPPLRRKRLSRLASFCRRLVRR